MSEKIDPFKVIASVTGSTRVRRSASNKVNPAAFKRVTTNLIALRDGRRLVSAKKDAYQKLNPASTGRIVCVLLKDGVAPSVINEYSGSGDLPEVSKRFQWQQIFDAASAQGSDSLAELAAKGRTSVAQVCSAFGVQAPKSE